MAETNRVVHIWDLSSGEKVGPGLHHPAVVNVIQFDADGSRVITGCADGFARTWDVATGKESGLPLRHGDVINCLCISPDGRWVFTGADDKRVRRWDRRTGVEMEPSLPHEAAVNACELSADGCRIVTSSRDRKARVWDAVSGRPLTAPLNHQVIDRMQKDGYGPVLSRDGQRVVTRAESWNAQIWDAASGRAIGPQLKHSGGITSISISPNGRRVSTSSYDSRAMVWDADRGEQVLSALRHRHFIRDAVFSPDNLRFATCGADNMARLWDVATGLPLTPPLTHSDGDAMLVPKADVIQLWFDPDGRRLVSRCRDGTIRVWDVSLDDRSPEEWLAAARVLSSHWLDDKDVLRVVTHEDRLKSWASMTARRSKDWAASLGRTPAWQQRQAEAAEAAGQWFAAAFHWGRLAAAQPDNETWRLRRQTAERHLKLLNQGDGDIKSPTPPKK
jgi:WD40 repeat protein